MTASDALQEAKHAISDLMGVHFQGYPAALKRLGRAFAAVELTPFVDELKRKGSLEKLLEDAQPGGMVGGALLEWPDDPEEEMGTTLLLVDKMAGDPDWAANFCHDYFYGGSKVVAGLHLFARNHLAPFSRRFERYVVSKLPASKSDRRSAGDPATGRVFLVHGHDEGPRETVARFLQTLGLSPIILHEQPNRGASIQQKLDANADVAFAVVLLTPDDQGCAKTDTELKSRARQNVVLELGYFIGRLGTDRVCAIKKGDIEIPSDYHGIGWVAWEGEWRLSLARELKAAGFDIDMNAAV